jgi:hypothetical protein
VAAGFSRVAPYGANVGMRLDAQPLVLTGRYSTRCRSFLFLPIGMAISARWSSLPRFWADLHLVREYSSAQLHEVWVGNWDVDGIETPGYQPLSTLFNHSRAIGFREAVQVQRIVVIVLFAAFLASLSLLAKRVGLSRHASRQ